MPAKRKAVGKSKKTALMSTVSSGVSECIVDGEDDALFCEGGLLHRYCAGIPLKSSRNCPRRPPRFSVYSCALQTHERDTAALNERVKSLAAELEDLLDGGAADKERATKGAVALPITVSNAGHRRPSQDGNNGRGGDMGV